MKRFVKTNFISCMDEIRETNSEQGAIPVVETSVSSVARFTASVEQPLVPLERNGVDNSGSDTGPVLTSGEEPHFVPAQEPVPVIVSSGGVSIGDIWSNEETSFRVDGVTAVGGVNIRFRTRDTLEGSKSSFIRRARALFEKKKLLPNGEWFFGSGEEIRKFIEQNEYRLEKRKEEKEK
jgi:hypothetical protein